MTSLLLLGKEWTVLLFVILSLFAVFALAKLMNVKEDPSQLSAVAR